MNVPVRAVECLLLNSDGRWIVSLSLAAAHRQIYSTPKAESATLWIAVRGNYFAPDVASISDGDSGGIESRTRALGRATPGDSLFRR